MKPRTILATGFGLAAIVAFLFLPDRGEWVAFGFALLAALLTDYKAAEAAIKGLVSLRMGRATDDDSGDSA